MKADKPERGLEAAIRRRVGVGHFVFDENTESVFVGPVTDTEHPHGAVDRCELSPEAKKFLKGDLPLQRLDEISLLMHAPEAETS